METEHQTEKKETIPFFPDHITTEFKVVIGILVIVVIIGLVGLLSPVGLQDPADPINTPEHVKPEWYFLSLYQLLKYIPKTTGAVAPVLLVLLVFIWPFLDRKDDSKKAIRSRLIVTIIGLVVIIALTVWGEVS
jgi:quinol-cytochrome oxidoreductase complex cytochrome b subunit